MRSLVAVARREIIEKRFVFAAAVIAGVIPILVPMARQLSGDSALIARQMTALILASAMGAGLALILGASLFSAELLGKRISFYFSKPISTWQLWLGKLLGATVLVVGGMLLPLLPTMVLDHGLPELADFYGGATAAVLWAIVVLLFGMLLANAISISIRSRSWLAMLDVVACAGFMLLGAALIVRLIPVWIVLFRRVRPLYLLGTVVLFIVGVVLVASYRAIAAGRTDLKTVHRRQFETLWAPVGAVLVAVAIYSVWAFSTTPGGVAIQSARAAGPSGWLWIDGVGRGAFTSFLYDTRSGHSTRIPGWNVRKMGWSSDGRIIVWAETFDTRLMASLLHVRSLLRVSNDESSGSGVIKLLRMDAQNPQVMTTNISFPSTAKGLFLSHDGSRIAVVDQDLLSVFDQSGHLLGAFHFSAGGSFDDAWFSGPGRIRVLRSRRRSDLPELWLESHEIDVSHRIITKTGRSRISDHGSYRRSAAGDRLMYRDERKGLLSLVDARSLVEISNFMVTFERLTDHDLRADGGVILLGNDKTDCYVQLLSAAGVPEGRIRLGASAFAQLGVETTDGAFPVLIWGKPGALSSLMLIDTRRRTAKLIANGLHPVTTSWFWLESEPWPPGCEAGKLFIDAEGAVVRFDPSTGDRHTILRSH
ncbi:MAG: hypothetical protein ABI592_07025 [Acidobacteriota bacterium]